MPNTQPIPTIIIASHKLEILNSFPVKLSAIPPTRAISIANPPINPVTPVPGMTNISINKNISPTMNNTIIQLDAIPVIYKGKKYNTADIIAATVGNPSPGLCNSKYIPPTINIINIACTAGFEKNPMSQSVKSGSNELIVYSFTLFFFNTSLIEVASPSQ